MASSLNKFQYGPTNFFLCTKNSNDKPMSISEMSLVAILSISE